MSLQEAVTLAGSFESLLPHLVARPPRILAWHNGSYVCGVSMLQVGTISPKAWAQARNVDVRTNRVYVRDDLFYIDVELERAAVEALFAPPAPTTQTWQSPPPTKAPAFFQWVLKEIPWPEDESPSEYAERTYPLMRQHVVKPGLMSSFIRRLQENRRDAVVEKQRKGKKGPG
jgi:hypothetical protein